MKLVMLFFNLYLIVLGAKPEKLDQIEPEDFDHSAFMGYVEIDGTKDNN
jgi:hypothetical protein